MRILLINALLLIAAAVLGAAACSLAGFNVHWRLMFLALLLSLTAMSDGVGLLLAARSQGPGALAMGALGATVCHLLICGMGLVAVTHLARPAGAFSIWLAWFYFAGLYIVVMSCIRVVRLATMPANQAKVVESADHTAPLARPAVQGGK